MPTVRTDVLEIAYEQGGPADGPPVLLLHGWPDAPRSFNAVAPLLHAAGYRTIAPYLRGFGPTRFLSRATPRVGTAVALAKDALDLADRLHLGRFAVVGHDWGARTAYTLAAVAPERVTAIAALSVAFAPRGESQVPAFEQARHYWYQWFMCTDGGVEEVTADPVAFARIQWETWSPHGWFDIAEFARTAESFANPDWVAISLNSYRSRWRKGEKKDLRHLALQRRLEATTLLGTPTLMIQGGADTCLLPNKSEGRERYFTGGYKRLVLAGIGHFPQREAPDAVAEAILNLLEPWR